MDYRMDTYEMPWRFNFEALGVAGWLAGVPLSWAAWRMSGLPGAPFFWAAAICAVMVLVRLPAAVRLYRMKTRLRNTLGPVIIEAPALERATRARPDALWLGWGFQWSQPHAQKAYEILKRDARKLVPSREADMGWYWIHGIGEADADVYCPLAHTEGHIFLIGTTGSGKSTLLRLLVHQAVQRGEVVLVIDPKGDKGLKRTAQRACERRGDPGLFVNFHPAFPEESCRIDTLHNFNRPSELASRIAALIPAESGSDPFKAFSQKSLDNIAQGLWVIEKRPSLANLRRYLEGGAAKLVVMALTAHFDRCKPDWREAAQAYLKRAGDFDTQALRLIRFYRAEIQESWPEWNLDGLLSLYEHDRTHFNKMVASLLPIMNMLTTGDLTALLSPDAAGGEDPRPLTNIARIIRQGQTAYIGLDSLSDAMVGGALGSILLADAAGVAGDRYNFASGERIITIVIDEGAEVVNEPLIQLLNKGRGAGIRLIIATQTISDFVAKLASADRAKRLFGNMNNLITLRVTDMDSQQFVAGNLPKTYVKSPVPSQGLSTLAGNPVLYSNSQDVRLAEERVELFPPELLGSLPNFHYIAKLSGNRFVKGYIPILKD